MFLINTIDKITAELAIYQNEQRENVFRLIQQASKLEYDNSTVKICATFEIRQFLKGTTP
jgi:hypothetical protein